MLSTTDIESLLKGFGEPGNISVDTMALSLNAKRSQRQKKGEELHAFAMLSSEIEQLDEVLVSIIDANAYDFKFQIAVGVPSSALTHWSFLEFVFRANQGNKPELDVFICDPLGTRQSILLALTFSRVIKFGGLNDFCDTTIYLTKTVLQVAGRTCPYFALDSIAMLSNQSDFYDLYSYMKRNEDEQEKSKYQALIEQYKESVKDCMEEDALNEMHDFKFVISALPPRLLRTTQSLKTLDEEMEKSADLPMNKKGTPFRLSTSRYRLIVEDRDGDKQERNLRVNTKMKTEAEQLKKHINQLIEGPAEVKEEKKGKKSSEGKEEQDVYISTPMENHQHKESQDSMSVAAASPLSAAIQSQRIIGLKDWVSETLTTQAISELTFS